MLCSFKHEDTIKTADDVARFHYCEPFKCRLAELPLATLAPKGKEQARRWLIGVIDGQIKRVREIRAELEEIAEADAAEAPARLKYEIGPEGDKHRRYVLSNGRLVSKSVNDFLKARTMSETGIFDSVAADRHNRDVPSGLAPSVEIGAEKQVDLGETRQELAELNGNTPVDDDEQAWSRRATPAEVDGQTPDPSHDQEASCDDDLFLRNEPNAEFVSGPLSVVRGHVVPINEPGAPNATADVRDDKNLEAEIARLKASKSSRDEVARRTPIRAEGLRKLNEECRNEEQEARVAAHRSRRRRGKIGVLGSRKMPAPSWDREASCDDDPILRNEANVEFVSGPWSVVSGPLPVDVGTVEAVDEPKAMNEPSAVPEIATNPPTEDPEHAANKATDGGSDPAGSEKTGTGAVPEPVSSVGNAGPLGGEPDPDFQEKLERLAANKKAADEFHRREMIRVENIRKFDQQWWIEAEAAEAACRARGRGHQYGNPGDRETASPNLPLEARDDDNRNEIARRRASIQQLKALQFQQWREEKIRKARAAGLTDFPFPASEAQSGPDKS